MIQDDVELLDRLAEEAEWLEYCPCMEFHEKPYCICEDLE